MLSIEKAIENIQSDNIDDETKEVAIRALKSIPKLIDSITLWAANARQNENLIASNILTDISDLVKMAQDQIEGK